MMARSRGLQSLNGFGRTAIVVPRTLLALDILCYLDARASMRAPTTTISADLNITVPYTRNIASQLIDAGFVQSVRGRDGGIRLARHPRAIYLGDVVRFFDQLRQCNLSEAEGCEQFDDVVVEAREKFIDVLNDHCLADLLALGSRPGATRPEETSRRGPLENFSSVKCFGP